MNNEGRTPQKKLTHMDGLAVRSSDWLGLYREIRKNRKWRTAPISRRCEVRSTPDEYCGRPASFAYPVGSVGWMALCKGHADKHPEALHVNTLLSEGEQWA